mmetsp:Transcript_20328/g.42619  ORF Transcript_20328/g.42619 Transcript_20328/m.42619 type:complete len:293 (+) Transcript_20328:307-1185(+)
MLYAVCTPFIPPMNVCRNLAMAVRPPRSIQTCPLPNYWRPIVEKLPRVFYERPPNWAFPVPVFILMKIASRNIDTSAIKPLNLMDPNHPWHNIWILPPLWKFVNAIKSKPSIQDMDSCRKMNSLPRPCKKPVLPLSDRRWKICKPLEIKRPHGDAPLKPKSPWSPEVPKPLRRPMKPPIGLPIPTINVIIPSLSRHSWVGEVAAFALSPRPMIWLPCLPKRPMKPPPPLAMDDALSKSTSNNPDTLKSNVWEMAVATSCIYGIGIAVCNVVIKKSLNWPRPKGCRKRHDIRF